jgi:predicted SAM-dependent methyltransferase
MIRFALSKLLATQPTPVQAAARNLWREIQLARTARQAGRQFAALRGRKDLKVHLGCGGELKAGWVNVDLDLNGLVPPRRPEQADDTLFILHDLRSGTLPLADESCAVFYSSHFMEHLEYHEGLRLMGDCLRMLRPGGIFRAGLPHFRKMFRAYLDADHHYFDLIDARQWLPDRPPETVTLVDHVNLGVYQWGEHKFIYDEEKICIVLRHLGYRSAEIVPYQEGLDPENEVRQRYSFYVQAVK